MEKHQLSNNFTMLHHLPGIINIMQVLNLIMYGFVISQPMFFVMAINNLQKSIRVSPQKMLDAIGKIIYSHRQILNYLILAISVLLLLLLNRSIENILLIIVIPVLFNLVNRLIPAQKNTMPANQPMYNW